MNDIEEVYRFVADGRWTSALDLLHRAGADAREPAAKRAASILVASVVDAIECEPNDVPEAVLERLLLMEHAGLVALGGVQRGLVVDLLIDRNRDAPARALTFARFAPDNSNSAAVIAQFGPPEAETIQDLSYHARIDVSDPGAVTRAGQPLFRSKQESAFYRAACSVFPEWLVYPNVAVSSAIDYSAVAGRLLPEERAYFFRAVVDCVVFVPEDEYRPRWFFELDSPLHDDLHRGGRDRQKDRIVTLAGYRLHRIRATSKGQTEDEFERLLGRLIEAD